LAPEVEEIKQKKIKKITIDMSASLLKKEFEEKNKFTQ